MRFRIFGTEVYFSFLFMAVITLMLAFDKTGLLLPTLFAVTLHEMGHLFMMWLLGCVPKSVKFIPASVQITRSFSKGYTNEILIAFFGPLVNFVLFVVLYYNFLCYDNVGTLQFALLNLIIGVFNLLPVKGLDGGTVLYCLLCKKIDEHKAAVILGSINLAIGVLALVSAITLLFRGVFNPSLFIMSLYLLVISLIKK